jgi:soluble lytic murein transglycosylase-like protein
LSTARKSLVAMSALALLAAAAPSQAISVQDYLKLRRASKTDRAIRYVDVAANPLDYAGKVIELRGTVNGSIRKDAGLSFMLTLDDKQAILLDSPSADTPIVSQVSNQSVRVLARIAQPMNGNVVPLEVLGVAYDAEVTLKEQEVEQREAAERARQQAEARARQSASGRVVFASRGGQGGGTMPIIGPLSDQARKYLPAAAQAIYPYYKAYIWKCNKKLTERELDDITTGLLYYSVANTIDPRLVVAVFIAESDFDPRCTSHKGAMGLGQIMPDEARRYRVSDPYSPIENIRASIALLKEKLIRYSEGTRDDVLTLRQVQLALAAYNAGPGAVKKYGGVPPYRETQGYIKRILRRYSELCAPVSG